MGDKRRNRTPPVKTDYCGNTKQIGLLNWRRECPGTAREEWSGEFGCKVLCVKGPPKAHKQSGSGCCLMWRLMSATKNQENKV